MVEPLVNPVRIVEWREWFSMFSGTPVRRENSAAERPARMGSSAVHTSNGRALWMRRASRRPFTEKDHFEAGTGYTITLFASETGDVRACVSTMITYSSTRRDISRAHRTAWPSESASATRLSSPIDKTRNGVSALIEYDNSIRM